MIRESEHSAYSSACCREKTLQTAVANQMSKTVVSFLGTGMLARVV